MKKIQVYLRHCYYSKIQELPDRIRPSWFNKIKVFENFKNTINSDIADYTIIYDQHYGKIENTFLSEEKNVRIIDSGNENGSFLETLEIIKNDQLSDDTIVYLLEDDYLHKPGWCEILLEGFTIPTSYVTLYDFDFFYNSEYFCRLFLTKNLHWRAVPSTTNTFASRYKTLMEDYELHRHFSLNYCGIEDGEIEKSYQFSKDYEKFWVLNKKEKPIISPIPGYSTHCDANHLTPHIDWKQIIDQTYTPKTKTKTLNHLYY